MVEPAAVKPTFVTVEPAAVEPTAVQPGKPAAVKPATTPMKSPAAMSGIGHLWLNNSGSKQQCRCGMPENPSDGPPGPVIGSLVRQSLLPKPRCGSARQPRAAFTRYSIALYVCLRLRRVQLADRQSRASVRGFSLLRWPGARMSFPGLTCRDRRGGRGRRRSGSRGGLQAQPARSPAHSRSRRIRALQPRAARPATG